MSPIDDFDAEESDDGMDQRRQHYRVQIDPSAGLQVTIRAPAGQFVGQLVDVSAAGAGVRFEGDEAPHLAVGAEVDLLFRWPGLNLSVAARVQHRNEDDEGRRYGFRFLQPQLIDASIPPTARTLFNRRRVTRVTPDPLHPVAVMLSPYPDGVPVEARLQDISELGAGISVEGARESGLIDTTTVSVAIEFPDARQPVLMVGHIRYRRLGGRGIFYGIEFDGELTELWERQVEAIERYVIARQRAKLRDAG